MPNPTVPNVPVDVPLEMIQTPAPDLMAAVKASIEETNAAAGVEPVQPVEPVEPVQPAIDPATPPVEPVVDPLADPAKPPVEAVTEPAQPVVTAEPVEPAAKRPSDEFGELPTNLKQETRERFETVKKKYDEVVEVRDRAELAAKTWHETITSTGATPEQFGALLRVVKDINDRTPESMRRAYDAISQQQVELAKLLGLPASGYDPLDDHPDLKQRVEDSVDFTREDALEIAASRGRGKVAQASNERLTEQQQAQQQHQAGIDSVAALGRELRAAGEATFTAKLPALEAITSTVIAQLPPDKWTAAIREAYAKLPTPRAAEAAPLPRTPNPLRPGGGGADGFDKKPSSAHEAVKFALARGTG